jgi:hypothetical protein
VQLTPKPPWAFALVTTDLAHTQTNFGDYLLTAKKDPVAAVRQYEAAFQRLDDLLKGEPDNLDLRRRVAMLHYRLGVVASDRSFAATLAGAAYDIALRQWHLAKCLAIRESLASIDPTDTQGQVELMLILARVGRIQDAEKIADGLLRKGAKERQILFQTACGFAIAGTWPGEGAGRYRDRAFEILNSLTKAGWNDRFGLETDPDLEGVRGDKQFAEMVKKLESP